MSTAKKRPYRSKRRQQQAEETRDRIVSCARELFLEAGFGSTTIGKIAAKAGVSPPTVYAVFGSKRGILFALLDDMTRRANLSAFADAIEAATGDPHRQLAEVITFNVRLYEGSIELISLVRTVAGIEPDLLAMWEEGEARRRRAHLKLVAEWDRAGALAVGVDVKRATDLLWSMSGPDVYRLLIVESDWSQAEFRRWLTASLTQMILMP